MPGKLFFHGIPVEPGDRAQPPGNGSPRPATGLQIPGEALDVSAASLEQLDLALLAPAHELAQVQLVGLAGQAAVSGQEPS
jgi:hypothetical protein